MDIEIKRIGAEASRKGPADWFTGTVRIDCKRPTSAYPLRMARSLL